MATILYITQSVTKVHAATLYYFVRQLIVIILSQLSITTYTNWGWWHTARIFDNDCTMIHFWNYIRTLIGESISSSGPEMRDFLSTAFLVLLGLPSVEGGGISSHSLGLPVRTERTEESLINPTLSVGCCSDCMIVLSNDEKGATVVITYYNITICVSAYNYYWRLRGCQNWSMCLFWLK